MTENRRSDARTGELLRHWRRLRGLSQIELANLAGTSARNLSFIETGKAAPSEDLLDRICSILAIDATVCDLLRRSIGYGRTYASFDLSEPEMARVLEILKMTLERLEPCPAMVVNRKTDVIAVNGAAVRMLSWVAGDTKLFQQGVVNVSELALSPDGLKPFLENWEDVAQRILDRMVRELVIEPDAEMAETYERWLAIDGIPPEWRRPPKGDADPLISFRYVKHGRRVNLESLVTTIGTPPNTNFQELRVRYFVPSDEASHRFLLDLQEGVVEAASPTSTQSGPGWVERPLAGTKPAPETTIPAAAAPDGRGDGGVDPTRAPGAGASVWSA